MENFDITRFFKTLNNSKLYICITILLFIFVGYFYSFYYVTPMYKSSATVVLAQNDSVDVNEEAITGQDIALNQNLLSTYTKLTKSDRVLEQVIKNLKLDMSLQELYGLITVQPMNNTQVFKISVTNKDNILAKDIANEVVEVFSKEVTSLYNMNNIHTVDLAEVSNTPYNVNHIKDMLIFSMIGFALSLGIVAIIYMLDTSIKCEQDIEKYTELSVLSTIPVYQNKENVRVSELIVNDQPKDPVSECFKTFRTNIMFSSKNKDLNTILVTSSNMGEGKSFVSSNLAVTFAQSGKRVILVDTDMRKGRVNKIFNIENKSGLSNCLSDIAENGELVNINWYIQKTKVANLHVMTSGIVPPNPSELVSSPNMRKFIEALKTQYDIVICDGTPCMLVSDSIALSKIVDATVIVTASRTTKIDTLQKVKKSIEIVGGNIAGAIINKMEVSPKEYQNSYYYGNKNDKEIKTQIVLSDNTLKNNLCINNDLEDIEDIEDIINEEEYNIKTEDDNLSKLSNIITNNTKEVLQLKNMYKNVIKNSIEAINKEDTSTASILEEIENIKKTYEQNIEEQNNRFCDINYKIEQMDFDERIDAQSNNILYELDNIKEAYEYTIKEQREKIEQLEEKIEAINFDDKFAETSDNMLYALNNIKYTYEDAINLQSKTITELEEKLTNNVDNKFNEQSSNLLEELENIKQTYENTMNMQSENITELEKKITNNVDTKFTKQAKSIVNGLINIKGIYENTMKAQSENITELEKKITNNVDNKFNEQSSNLLEELENIKQIYENTMNMQSENITELEKKITNNVDTKFTKQAKSIVNGLINIKGIYENTMKAQQESIIELEKKITNNVDNKFLEQQNSILDELANIKETYENAINEQSQSIKILEEKITDNVENKFDEQSSNILNELDDVKQRYEEAIKEQNENIQSLEERIANINLDEKFDEQQNSILDELNKVKAAYEEAVSIQNRQIATLDNKISSFNNYEVLAAINGIYKELYGMSERFSYLEQKALENEKLIRTINDISYNGYNNYQYIDYKKSDEKIKGKLDEKVVRIQDYLENNYNATNETVTNILNTNTSKNTKKNSNATIGTASTTRKNSGVTIGTASTTRKNSNVTIGSASSASKNNNVKTEIANSTSRNNNLTTENSTNKNNVAISTNSKINQNNDETIRKVNTEMERTVKAVKNASKNEETNSNINNVTTASKVAKNSNDLPKATMTSKLHVETNATEEPKSISTNKVEFIDYSKIKNKPKKGFFNFNHKEEEEEVAIVSQILCGKKESVG